MFEKKKCIVKVVKDVPYWFWIVSHVNPLFVICYFFFFLNFFLPVKKLSVKLSSKFEYMQVLVGHLLLRNPA